MSTQVEQGESTVETGFKVMDSDIHVREPRDLWVKYIEPRFKDQAPQFIPNGAESAAWHFAGKVFPA